MSETVAFFETVTAAAAALKNADPQFTDFVRVLYRNTALQDVAGYSPTELAVLAQQAWGRVIKNAAGQSFVGTFIPGDEDEAFHHKCTALLAVNDDAPFLFDSVMNEAIQSTRLIAAFHPIIDLGGRAVSVILLLAEPLANEDAHKKLESSVVLALDDVRYAVRDFSAMEAKLAETIGWLKAAPDAIASDVRDESVAFLAWLSGNFIFLGCRDYNFTDEITPRLDPVSGSSLGLLSDKARRIVRKDATSREISTDVRDFLCRPEPVVIAKSNEMSRVHRRAYMDYIGVKTFDNKGKLIGERRFVGLFTSSAYYMRPFDIPLLRYKVKAVLSGFNAPKGGHDSNALVHIIDTFPRDELFQISEDELTETVTGILQLGERPLVRIFPRIDAFGRFVTCIAYVPRDRYTPEVSRKIHALLALRYGGKATYVLPFLNQTAQARVYYIIERPTDTAGEAVSLDVRVADVEKELRHILRSWDDSYCELARKNFGEADISAGPSQARGFSASYRDVFGPYDAVEDITQFRTLIDSKRGIEACISPSSGGVKGVYHLKLYGMGQTLPLSQSLPVIENFALNAIKENAYPVSVLHAGKTSPAFILDFEVHCGALDGRFRDVKQKLESALEAALTGTMESGGFNRLVAEAGLSGREVVILRAVAKFLRQITVPFGLRYMAEALSRNAAIAGMLIKLFHARLDPETADAAIAEKISAEIEVALADVSSLDDDRIIRRFRNVISNILRTNFYQPAEDGGPKPCLSFKLDSRKLEGVPAPRPLVEIFVYAPQVEGVHLRFGKVARGGLRWSDRQEDFRTEILGLVKAQQVKNAVIVPVGAKGGFYPKHLPKNGTREEVMAEAISSYRTFINALLDVTDNIDASGEVVPPPHLVRHDADDPYLVVAADKGTATFSDYANEIAEKRGFWTGDAFASGGSHGYDHKVMGITARGAWEAVKRHFREMGRDIQAEPFTAIGVGDMSGDVFGNGMLLSKQTKLIAAFDHRNIFIDPNPDPALSWVERKRLFDLPRSSWADYNKDLISKGGAILDRKAKELKLTDEMRAITGLSVDTITPTDLIRALLKSEADLLFFGGIGTYIKGTDQVNADAGDRANDPVRINAPELKVKVVGEGANLGVTQKGRIEAAQHGVRINTDAIDNSAGVDTSDHEVNLKILIRGPYARGEITAEERDDLLRQMTDEVADQVLRDNYDQTLALSVAESRAVVDLDTYRRFIIALEKKGHLDREVEFLPSEQEFDRRARNGLGLTRPELAVLLAYAKLTLKGEILDGTLPDDPDVANTLTGYFPPEAVARFPAEPENHRLRREIITSALVNRIVNICGPVFVHRLCEISGATPERIARGYLCAESAFGIRELKAEIDAQDGRMDPVQQIAMYDQISETMRRLALWFVVNVPIGASVAGTAELYRDGVQALRGHFSALVSPAEAEDTNARIAAYREAGAPEALADHIGALPLMATAPEIIVLAKLRSIELELTAGAYFAVGKVSGLDRLRLAATNLRGADHWERQATRRILDDLYASERLLAAAALNAHSFGSGRDAGVEAAENWAASHEESVARVRDFITDVLSKKPMTLAKLTLAASQVRELASGAN